MHLLPNKKKDVKQLLEEMKANKTNRSSNYGSLSGNKSNMSYSQKSDVGSFSNNNFSNRPYRELGSQMPFNLQISSVPRSREQNNYRMSPQNPQIINFRQSHSMDSVRERNQYSFSPFNPYNFQNTGFTQPNRVMKFSETPIQQNFRNHMYFQPNNQSSQYSTMSKDWDNMSQGNASQSSRFPHKYSDALDLSVHSYYQDQDGSGFMENSLKKGHPNQNYKQQTNNRASESMKNQPNYSKNFTQDSNRHKNSINFSQINHYGMEQIRQVSVDLSSSKQTPIKVFSSEKNKSLKASKCKNLTSDCELQTQSVHIISESKYKKFIIMNQPEITQNIRILSQDKKKYLKSVQNIVKVKQKMLEIKIKILEQAESIKKSNKYDFITFNPQKWQRQKFESFEHAPAKNKYQQIQI